MSQKPPPPPPPPPKTGSFLVRKASASAGNGLLTVTKDVILAYVVLRELLIFDLLQEVKGDTVTPLPFFWCAFRLH